MPVIQCPGCNKKLKLKALREGAKIKCPGCAQVFKPTAESGESGDPAATAKRKPAAAKAPVKKKPAASKAPAARPTKKRPVKKKRPAPVDDFEDDYDDFGGDDFGGDDYGGDDFGGDDFGQPARRPTSGGKKAAKKKPAAKKSKTPLIIVLAIVGVAAIGGGALFLMSGESGSGDTGANVAENAGGGGDAGASGDEHNNGGDNGGGNNNGGGGHDGGGGNDAGHGHGQQAAAPVAAAAKNLPQATNPDFKWLPNETEVFAKLQINRLIDGPLGELLKIPEVAEPLAEMEKQAGLQLTDIESITIGVTGISKTIKDEIAPSPDHFPFVAVIRCKTRVETAKFQALIPNAVSSNHENRPYLQLSDGQTPPLALVNGDETTLLLCPESTISSVVNSSSLPKTGITDQMISGQSTVEVVFVPQDADTVFGTEPPQPQSDPTKQMMVDFMTAMKPVTEGLSLRVTLSKDIETTINVITEDGQSAATATTAIRKFVSDVIRIQEDEVEGQRPAAMQAMLDLGIPLLKTLQIESVGSSAEAKLLQPGAGDQMKQQLATMAPMLPMMIRGAMAGMQQQMAGSAAPPGQPSPGFTRGVGSPENLSGAGSLANVSSKENMKQIALAMHYFHDAYGRFPNAAAKSADGTPLLSWRVHLLPFLGLKDLYDQFNLEEPWDSPTNRPLVEQMPDVYKSATAQTSPGKTVYLVPVSAGTMFENEKGRMIGRLADGASNTVMLVEVEASKAVYWTQPTDFEVNSANPLEGLAKNPSNAVSLLMADASIRDVPPTLDTQTANNLFQVADGNAINLP